MPSRLALKPGVDAAVALPNRLGSRLRNEDALWVRVRSPEKEAEAQEILVRHGAEGVHVHEIELVKTPDDLPLASLRPDPWLGDERLGQP